MNAKSSLEQRNLSFGLLEAYKTLTSLNYYTGIMHEAIIDANAPPDLQASLADTPSSIGSLSAPVFVPAPAAAKSSKKRCKNTYTDDRKKEIDCRRSMLASLWRRYDGFFGAFLAGAVGSDFKAKESKKSMGPSVDVPSVSPWTRFSRWFGRKG
ncbi:hypothetical protein D9613_004561 [Agrocybe pediades]|uniref:Uncharacterized protein n=1 Tax=Agrocybe pediades TaxID=84607 RepID=A0A8H4QJE3_9AGAR|nr:hypothetical protein D9613_004561 [Agrocybe pediades]